MEKMKVMNRVKIMKMILFYKKKNLYYQNMTPKKNTQMKNYFKNLCFQKKYSEDSEIN